MAQEITSQDQNTGTSADKLNVVYTTSTAANGKQQKDTFSEELIL